MPNVTVPGAHGATLNLNFDTKSGAVLAQQIALVLRSGLAGHTIQAADTADGPPPPLPLGVNGELVVSKTGTTLAPHGYTYVVDTAHAAVIYGSGDANQRILAGGGNLTYHAMAGSGMIVTGGGNNSIDIANADSGSWLIAMGNGNDTIRAMGAGNDTISVGTGKHAIQLGAGRSIVTTEGSDTILASNGQETIDASGSDGAQVIYGNASKLFFVAGDGPATVFGGSGSATVFGGGGRELLFGGSSGHNFLQAGGGQATLFGGGDGDQLYAGGDEAQALHAGSGNETLFGGFASGNDSFYGGSGRDQIFGGVGENTFVAGSGAATVTAGPGSGNLFEFISGLGGGKELVLGLTDPSQIRIDLLGFGENEVSGALATQVRSSGGVTISLSDRTKVTFQNISGLTRSNFAASGEEGNRDDGFHHPRSGGDN